MSNREDYLLKIDHARVSRAKELSNMKMKYASSKDYLDHKALIVLSYAHWEGFFNECVDIYIDYLQLCRIKVKDISWSMLCGVIKSGLYSMRDRNFSHESLVEFSSKLEKYQDETFDVFDRTVVMSKSNLNFVRLREVFELLKFETAAFNRYRIKLEKNVVSWRHAVAHGTSPELEDFDAKSHVQLVLDLLLLLADRFQTAMYDVDEVKVAA